MTSGTSRRERLAALLRPVVVGAGYHLEEVVTTPAGRRTLVRVVVDGAGGVSLDQVAEVSRAISATLDANDGVVGPSPYVLEVSSPGVDRPLTQPRHWRATVGRLVQVTVAERGQVEGRLRAADDTGVVIEVDGTPLAVPYPSLGKGRVQVEFNRADETDETDEVDIDIDPADLDATEDEGDGEGDDGFGEPDEGSGTAGPGVQENASGLGEAS